MAPYQGIARMDHWPGYLNKERMQHADEFAAKQPDYNHWMAGESYIIQKLGSTVVLIENLAKRIDSLEKR